MELRSEAGNQGPLFSLIVVTLNSWLLLPRAHALAEVKDEEPLKTKRSVAGPSPRHAAGNSLRTEAGAVLAVPGRMEQGWAKHHMS